MLAVMKLSLCFKLQEISYPAFKNVPIILSHLDAAVISNSPKL